MCIRVSHGRDAQKQVTQLLRNVEGTTARQWLADVGEHLRCLLYTSDAADERSSVDLGGSRIIKKKNTVDNMMSTSHATNTIYSTDERDTHMKT